MKDWKSGGAVAERSGAMQAKAGTLKDSVLDCPKTKHAKVAPSNENFDKTQQLHKKIGQSKMAPIKNLHFSPKNTAISKKIFKIAVKTTRHSK